MSRVASWKSGTEGFSANTYVGLLSKTCELLPLMLPLLQLGSHVNPHQHPLPPAAAPSFGPSMLTVSC